MTLKLELQVRSYYQHIWATGVEVFGTLTKTSFKTGKGADEWRDFFKFLSSRFAIKENNSILPEHEKYSYQQIHKILVKKIKELNIIEQLNTYTSVYKSYWRENRPKGRSGKYALLILDNINKLEMAYPNYFMDTKQLTFYLSQIVLGDF
jgi:putative GTP pyrophosphokinase